jgi:hypothetical protein
MILLAASSCLPQAPVPLHYQPLFLTPYTWSRAADHVLFLWRKWQTRASFSNSLRMSEHGKCSLNVAIITELLETVSKRSRMLRAGWDSIPHNCWHTCRCQGHKEKIIIFRLNNLCQCLASNSVTNTNYNFDTRTAVHAIAQWTEHIGRWEFTICELQPNTI